MESGWGWINFSSKDRDRSLAIISVLKGKGVVDELGIGVSRDVISDSLFPGLSTIQTRAKYFLFTPIIVARYRKDKPNITLVKYFQEKESEYLECMASTYRGKDENGIFGITLDNAKSLQRKPSSIYWNGQQVLGIIRNNLHNRSLRHYFEQNRNKVNPDHYSEEDVPDSSTDKSGISLEEKIIVSFDPKNINLTDSEAKYLIETMKLKLVDDNKDCLFLNLLVDYELGRKFLSCDSFYEFYKEYIDDISNENLKKRVINAYNFSYYMYGAHLLYNLLLQEKIEDSQILEEYTEKFRLWLLDIKNVKYDHINHLESLQEVKSKANKFVEDWVSSIKSGKSMDILKKLIEEQEFKSKTGRARLKKSKLPPEVFNRVWYGMKYQDYRFNQVKNILTDIYKGLDLC
ncbi:hypothetical protein EW093_00785 [Thiospirochaeta perfilievii]|uniref:Uncharacterized protein n=1 Tax=Thiospirochaeta perfilievii TaxID=252967 RepID=A0A5C1Q8D2_9SPIO|nr:DUF6361 family protein [Thiospirochaeta perfilievii]QEN03300.1 hypothetical protein EW093_00785 [Thiospirochaeta perfilievii]